MTPTESWRALSILPSVINAERQALRLSQMDVALDDRRAAQSFADRIVASPAATDAALKLLDVLARPTPDPSA